MFNYYLGIDVSKGYSDFCLLDSNRCAVDKSFQLDDTYRGHTKLLSYLTDFFSNNPDSVIYVGLESTGGYEDNWYNFLMSFVDKLSIHVARLNPNRVKANSEASAKHNKTDKMSARDISEYLICHPEKICYNQEYHYPSLKRHWTFIRMLVKQKTQLLNQLESLLYSCMPEMLGFCRKGCPTWLLVLLKDYPTYAHFANVGVEELISNYPSITRKKATKLFKLLEHPIGKSDALSGEVIKSLVSEILHQIEVIKKQKSLLEKNYDEAREEVDLLLSFKGIGVYSAVGLLLNIGSIKRFGSVKHLASYFGLHPVYKQSGDRSWRGRMSKAGRSEPRAILYMVALSSLRSNPLIRQTYANHLSKGMNPKAAVGACMHKILRIVFGMLKNNTTFDIKIDEKNQERSQPSTLNSQDSKRNRLHDFDENAPISNREHKKRKEQQTQPQVEDIDKCGVIKPAALSS